MKKIATLPLASLLFLFCLHPSTAQQNLTGTYSMSADQTKLTLSLTQSGSQLTGSLKSSTGAVFELQGEVMDGAAAGICSGDGSSLYFEAYGQGNELTLGLIEADQFNMPDYNKAQYLLFTKQSLTPGQSGNITDKLFGNQQPTAAQTTPQPSPARNNNTTPQTARPSLGSSNIAPNEVGDPSWGFKFVPPAGWVHQKTGEGAILGHNTIAGMILVLPHKAENMQQMQQELMQGLQEEGSYLNLNGNLSPKGQNALAGDYSGIMEGTPVKARSMGLLSPHGGGVYLIAATTPDKLGNELISALEELSRNIQFFKLEVSDLMQHFTGTWSTFTTNSSTKICFCPNGVYSENYESSYSGNVRDGYGNVTADWGTAGQNSSEGRWTVSGTREAGQIIVILNNGNRITYNYKVQQENGRTFYGEYWINGKLYSKN